MLKKLAAFEPQAYALLRIVAGFNFCLHGAQKALGLLTDKPPVGLSDDPQRWLGGWIELLGGLLVMLGLRTREAAFVCSGTMAVAYTQFHWKLQGGEQLFPVVNRGGYALLYAFVFLFIAAKGSGVWALKRDEGVLTK